MNKKLIFLLAFVLFLVSTGGAYAIFSKTGKGDMAIAVTSQYKAPTSQGDAQTTETNEPKTEECPLNGQLYSKSQKAKWDVRRPMGIMIENHTEARPQSGISSADVVYEAVAEGGITRTLDVFYCEDAPYVGPIRSARIYFLRLIQGYGDHPLYVHVGGANKEGPADALGEINDMGWGGYNDLNEFSVPFPVFYRDYDRNPNVATEHTMYSSTKKLWDYAASKRQLTNVDEKGKSWNTTFKPWKFKDDAAQGDRGTIQKVSLVFWDQFAGDYGVTWNYDPASNSYSRMNGGKPHLDKNTGKPITVKNVVTVFSEESKANDGYEAGVHLLYKIIGTGKGIIFQDGKAIKMTWSKKDETSMLRFTDDSGKEIPFVRGKIFVEIVPTFSQDEVKY
jgi:hypothetical protein